MYQAKSGVISFSDGGGGRGVKIKVAQNGLKNISVLGFLIPDEIFEIGKMSQVATTKQAQNGTNAQTPDKSLHSLRDGATKICQRNESTTQNDAMCQTIYRANAPHWVSINHYFTQKKKRYSDRKNICARSYFG